MPDRVRQHLQAVDARVTGGIQPVHELGESEAAGPERKPPVSRVECRVLTGVGPPVVDVDERDLVAPQRPQHPPLRVSPEEMPAIEKKPAPLPADGFAERRSVLESCEAAVGRELEREPDACIGDGAGALLERANHLQVVERSENRSNARRRAGIRRHLGQAPGDRGSVLPSDRENTDVGAREPVVPQQPAEIGAAPSAQSEEIEADRLEAGSGGTLQDELERPQRLRIESGGSTTLWKGEPVERRQREARQVQSRDPS